MKIRTGIVFFCLLLVAVLKSQSPAATGDSSLVYQRAVDYLRLHKGQSVSIAIIRPGSIKCFYLREVGGRVQTVNDSSRVYELGAITSAYTSYILTTLIAEEKIKVNDDIRLYLSGSFPHLQTNFSYVEVYHLAAHLSGLPRLPHDFKTVVGYDSLNPYQHYPKQQLLQTLKATVLENNPGDVMNYSAYGQALLGLVLERVGGQDYDALLKQRICLPFGLKHTGTTIPTLKGINAFGDSVNCWQMNAFNPAGGLKSNLPDAARFLQHMMSRDTRAILLMRSPVYTGRPAMTLGWYRKEKQGTTLFCHSGITYGYSGFMGYIDESNCGVVVLTDHAESVESLALSILRNLKN